MAKLSEKQVLLTVVGASVLLCSAAGVGIWWAMGLVDEERQLIDQKESQIDAARKKIRKIKKAEEKVIVLRENVHEYVKMLPEDRELHKFFRTAQRFALQAGIQIDKAVPGRAGKATAFENVVYRFEFTANLWQYMKFINFFENYDRFVKVRDVRMTPTRHRGGCAAPPGCGLSTITELLQ